MNIVLVLVWLYTAFLKDWLNTQQLHFVRITDKNICDMHFS